MSHAPRRRQAARLAAVTLSACSAAVAGCASPMAELVVRAPNHGLHAHELAPGAPGPAGSSPWRVLSFPVEAPRALVRAYLLDPPAPRAPRGTILVVHGMGSSARAMSRLGRSLVDAGYRALLVDLRGHGASTGDRVTFGPGEARDLRAVLDGVERQGLLAHPLGVYGHSLGGVAGLELAAADPRVRAVVSVSAFCSLRNLVRPYLRSYLPEPLANTIQTRRIDEVVDAIGELVGSDPDRGALAAVARIEAPVLFVHGTQDVRVPPSHARSLYTAAAGPSRLQFLDGAGHDVDEVCLSPRALNLTVAWFHDRLGDEEPHAVRDVLAERRAPRARVIGLEVP